MDSLKLRVTPERVDELPTGLVWVEHGAQRAALFTPDEIEPGRRYPLLAVLHGAGRQDELLMKAYRDEAERRQALFLVPRSHGMTWDLIEHAVARNAPQPGGVAPSGRPDHDIFRRYPVDAGRLGLLGYSDGASYALSVGLSNPDLFCSVMAWAAGFVAIENEAAAPGTKRPAVLIEYGTHDELFPFEQVAVPMREQLEAFGCAVTFRVDEGGRHWPSGKFQGEALDWFFSESWQPRS